MIGKKTVLLQTHIKSTLQLSLSVSTCSFQIVYSVVECFPKCVVMQLIFKYPIPIFQVGIVSLNL